MFDARDAYYEQNLAIASKLRQSWADVLGASVTISHTEWAQYLSLLQTDASQVWQLRWIADFQDGFDFLHESVNSFDRANYGNWNNLVYGDLLSLAAQTADAQARAALYRQPEEILVETDAVMVPIFYGTNSIATKPYLQRSYGSGGFGGRIADWRMAWRVSLPLILMNM